LKGKQLLKKFGDLAKEQGVTKLELLKHDL